VITQYLQTTGFALVQNGPKASDLTVRLSPACIRLLTEASKRRGMSPGDLAATLIERSIFRGSLHAELSGESDAEVRAFISRTAKRIESNAPSRPLPVRARAWRSRSTKIGALASSCGPAVAFRGALVRYFCAGAAPPLPRIKAQALASSHRVFISMRSKL
jgi:hypothetical protein